MKIIRYMVLLCLILCFLTACEDVNKDDTKQLMETQIQVGDTVISLDEDMAEVLASLGESKDYTETKSCLYDGYDKVYTYDQVVITAYPKGDRDYVSGMEVTSAAVKLSSGLKVGDSLDVIKEKYDSDELVINNDTCLYETENYGVQFYLTGDDIDGIEIYKITE